jgi:hypothetical protein
MAFFSINHGTPAKNAIPNSQQRSCWTAMRKQHCMHHMAACAANTSHGLMFLKGIFKAFWLLSHTLVHIAKSTVVLKHSHDMTISRNTSAIITKSNQGTSQKTNFSSLLGRKRRHLAAIMIPAHIVLVFPLSWTTQRMILDLSPSQRAAN